VSRRSIGSHFAPALRLCAPALSQDLRAQRGRVPLQTRTAFSAAARLADGRLAAQLFVSALRGSCPAHARLVRSVGMANGCPHALSRILALIT